MTLFTSEDRFRNRLKNIDPSTMTPIEALNVLFELSEEAKT
jgi:hypothetical protein